MTTKWADELPDLLATTLAPLGFELVDLELRSGTVRVVVDRTDGADLETIAEATRAVSALLDTHDPMPGQRYTLEVSSPGIERPLRTPRHFIRAWARSSPSARRRGAKANVGSQAGWRRPTPTDSSSKVTTCPKAGDASRTPRWSGPAPSSSGAVSRAPPTVAVTVPRSTERCPSSLGADKEKVTTS